MIDNNGRTPPPNFWPELDLSTMSNGFEDAVRAYFDAWSKAGANVDGVSGTMADMLNDRNTIRVMELMSRAYFTWANQGLRYWRELTDRHSHYLSSLFSRLQTIRDDPSVSETERRTIIDEAEQYLREVIDVSLKEGRVLKQELERLSTELRDSVAEANPNGEPHRYGGVKN